MRRIFRHDLAGLALAVLLPAWGKTKEEASGKNESRAVKIAMREGLQFDPPRFTAKPGETLELNLENIDSTHQVHNLLVLQPGKLEEVVKAALALAEKGPERAFVPEHPAILASSGLVNPDQKAKLKVTLPNDKGVYPYVCTFPGHGFIMYGAIYCGEKMPKLKDDPNVPPTAKTAAIPGQGRRPFTQRIFMPMCSPAAIAVALPGTQNFCWDAAQCRLRYLWQGDFIDAGPHWRGKGAEVPELPTMPWWQAAQGDFPFRFASDESKIPTAKFLGYRLKENLPTFRYQIGEVEIEETLTAGATPGAVTQRFRFKNNTAKLILTTPTRREIAAGEPEITLTLQQP